MLRLRSPAMSWSPFRQPDEAQVRQTVRVRCGASVGVRWVWPVWAIEGSSKEVRRRASDRI